MVTSLTTSVQSTALLLKTLLLSTSQINIYRHTKDPKKRRRVRANLVGMAVLYAMLLGYGIAMCMGYGELGIIDAVPVLTALVLSMLAFVFTLFKTNGYLFNFKEYDLLVSLPFATKTVAASRFLYMYVKSLPWYLSISIAMMIGYGWYAHPGVLVYPVWVVLSLFVPILPMLAASFVGFLVARVSVGFKKTNIVQTVLTFAFVMLCMSSSYIVGYFFGDDEVFTVLRQVHAFTDRAASVYVPAGWFANAVVAGDVLGALLLVGTSVLLFVAVFFAVGRSYQRINSALMSHRAAKSYTMVAQRQRSVLNAIAFKELKRLTGSTTYMVNGALGEVFSVVLGVAVLVVGFDNIVASVMHDAPIDPVILQPAIPFIVYFFIGMVATTVCSPSLEGKNYWIVQSLPLDKRTLYQGKMLFNLYLSVPFMTFAVVCLCVSARVPVVDAVLYVVLGLALCAFSTAWGCVCGIKHLRLDWENEVEVIKQSTAVTVYLLPNMFVTMGLVVAVVFLGMQVNHALLALAFALVAGVLAALSYRRALTLAERG